jgi:glycosyltransferase involved in cell wall biosynthesis
MTRILALCNLYPPHHYGGYELGCHDVAARWRRRGHEVAVLTSDIRLPGVTETDTEPVERTLRLYWDDHVILTPPLRERLAIERHNQAALTEALDRHRPEVVSVWAMGAMSLGLLTTLVEREVPYVAVIQDDWMHYGPNIDQWSKLFLSHAARGRIVRAVTGVPTTLTDVGAGGAFCFVSDATRRYAEQHSRWRFPLSTVVWNGIDGDAFPVNDDAVERTAIRPWTWRLLYVGRIDERKGVDTVIRALPLLPDEATLLVAGRGDAEHHAELHALVAELGVGDRVEFTEVARSELAHVYASADAVVFPSRWAEPFGLVPVEAMACATPVLATGTGGSGEFCFDEVNCLRFPPNDATALAAQTRRLAADPDLRVRLVRAGHATARDLTVDRLADVLEEWHVAAATGYPAGPPADRPPPVPDTG